MDAEILCDKAVMFSEKIKEKVYTYIYIYIYRMSQEECAGLRGVFLMLNYTETPMLNYTKTPMSKVERLRR